MKNLSQLIQDQEGSLLLRHTRADRETLKYLLHDDFEELGASGNIVTKTDAIEWLLREEDNIQWTLSDFKLRILSGEIVLATYRAHKTDLANKTVKHSLRSSLWIRNGDHWALRFHQGTNLTR
jgi:hypothetical protein